MICALQVDSAFNSSIGMHNSIAIDGKATHVQITVDETRGAERPVNQQIFFILSQSLSESIVLKINGD